MKFRFPEISLCLLVLGSSPVEADVLVEESFDLSPGWNAIHLSVEPAVRDPQQALASIDWDSLWAWLPTEGEPRGGRWLAAYRAHPAFVGTLASLGGPGSYLLFTRSGGTLRLSGAVRAARPALRGGAFQLFGPIVSSASPPAFADYFSRLGVKEHIGQAFELSGGSYRRLASSDRLRAGAAYWLFPERDIAAPDPLRLGSGAGGLRFDAQTTMGDIVIDVGDGSTDGGGAGVGSRRLVMSARSVTGGGSGNADWIELQKPDGTFVPVGDGVPIDVPPEDTSVRLILRAATPEGSALSPGDEQALIELAAAEGSLRIGAELDVPSLEGIWIGDASITDCERPSFHGGGYAPSPEIRISLILEVPPTGPARLLPCVALLGARDGRRIEYRLEAALFHEPVTLAGTAADDGASGTLTGAVVLGADHPLNPYRHRYNPEHALGLDLVRSVRLSFGLEAPDPARENLLGKVGVIGGTYEEEIEGLAQEPIRLRGAFRLRRLAGGTVTPCAPAGQ